MVVLEGTGMGMWWSMFEQGNGREGVDCFEGYSTCLEAENERERGVTGGGNGVRDDLGLSAKMRYARIWAKRMA